MPLLNKGDATINYRRCLRKKANKFTIIEGRLFYIGNKGNDELRLVVSDPVERAKIVRAIHEQGHLGKNWTFDFDDWVKSLSIHVYFLLKPGISRTSKAITSKYYWEKSMHTDITSVVKTCQSCQKSKPKFKKTPGRLHPIPITPKVYIYIYTECIFQHWGNFCQSICMQQFTYCVFTVCI